jgi:hypothetical protein
MYTLNKIPMAFEELLCLQECIRWATILCIIPSNKHQLSHVCHLKFTHCPCVAEHMIGKYLQHVCSLTQSCMWLALHCTVYTYFGGCTHWNPVLLKETIQNEILCVSKSVVWYEKCVHIKACLVRSYTQPGAGQVYVYTCTWEFQLYSG